MIPGSAISLLLTTAGPAFNPRDFMDVKLYTGNGSTQTISGLNFSPDLVWIKGRSIAELHLMSDSVRGVPKNLYPNLTNAEDTTNYLSALTSDGFTVQNAPIVNSNASTYVAWCWDAGSSTASNPDGSITSQVRANASAGFSIVTYTGTGSNATVGHGLGVEPHLIICKSRSGSTGWLVYHNSLGNTNYLILDATDASAAAAAAWNNTTPTSTVFTIGTGSFVNTNGATQVSYCFAPVAGYSSFGSYTGNGSATGPVISGLGFQPYFVMIKASSTTGDWWMYDGARSPSNPRINKLKANTSGAEDTAGEDVDFQSDGFQIKTSDSGLNQNTATYIYAAFA
jgi:hypothetical protein